MKNRNSVPALAVVLLAASLALDAHAQTAPGRSVPGSVPSSAEVTAPLVGAQQGMADIGSGLSDITNALGNMFRPSPPNPAQQRADEAKVKRCEDAVRSLWDRVTQHFAQALNGFAASTNAAQVSGRITDQQAIAQRLKFRSDLETLMAIYQKLLRKFASCLDLRAHPDNSWSLDEGKRINNDDTFGLISSILAALPPASPSSSWELLQELSKQLDALR